MNWFCINNDNYGFASSVSARSGTLNFKYPQIKQIKNETIPTIKRGIKAKNGVEVDIGCAVNSDEILNQATINVRNVLTINTIPVKVAIALDFLNVSSYFAPPTLTLPIPGCIKAEKAKLRKATLILAKTAERDIKDRQIKRVFILEIINKDNFKVEEL